MHMLHANMSDAGGGSESLRLVKMFSESRSVELTERYQAALTIIGVIIFIVILFFGGGRL